MPSVFCQRIYHVKIIFEGPPTRQNSASEEKCTVNGFMANKLLKFLPRSLHLGQI
jgi:hypothetical protein